MDWELVVHKLVKIANIFIPHSHTSVSWMPVNFIRRNKGLYHFIKSLRSVKRNGVKEVIKAASANKRSHSSSLEDEALLTESERLSQEAEVFPRQITVSIITPLCNAPEQYLREMIESVLAQTYGNWELCLADGSDDERVREICTGYAQKDSRIKYKRLEKNPVMSENLNRAIEMSSGEFLGILDSKDILHPSALHEILKAISRENADFIYTDEAVFSEDHDITLKHHKPDYAIDTLCSHNYISDFTVFARKLMEEAGAFRSEFDGSHTYDLVLRYTDIASKVYHIPKLLYFSRNLNANNPGGNGLQAETAAEKAIKEHLDKRHSCAHVKNKMGLPGFYRVSYELTERPLVSIIIPNKDSAPILRNCLSSIYEKTTYDNYEIIIVENNSREKATFKYYEELKRYKNIHVVKWEGKGFNYSKICNFGAQYAKGKQLVFLNNDTVIITPNWIEEMLMYSQRNDVGAVGIKLYFLNGCIQHAGLVLGLGEIAGHIFLSEPHDSLGYMAKLQIVQNMSAVTAACMMIKSSVFKEAGLFNPDFSDSFNDIDLCLKIRKAGYLIVWTPYAEAYHLESKSRGYNTTRKKRRLLQRETAKFRAKWENELSKGDPYYNSNFSLTKADYSLK